MSDQERQDNDRVEELVYLRKELGRNHLNPKDYHLLLRWWTRHDPVSTRAGDAVAKLFPEVGEVFLRLDVD